MKKVFLRRLAAPAAAVLCLLGAATAAATDFETAVTIQGFETILDVSGTAADAQALADWILWTQVLDGPGTWGDLGPDVQILQTAGPDELVPISPGLLYLAQSDLDDVLSPAVADYEAGVITGAELRSFTQQILQDAFQEAGAPAADFIASIDNGF